MGFQFLAPLFLAGLAAVGVPLLVHLTHRERREAIVFPSLMFLRKVPLRQARRQRIRHWLLFVLRTAAVILIVAAFARPLLDRPAVTSARAARDVIILADHSYSMGYRGRWARAQAAARDVVRGLGSSDRAAFVLFDDHAGSAQAPTADKQAVLQLIDAAKPGAGATRFAPALRLARDLLDDSTRRREVVLISDFQRVGWDQNPDVRLPAGTRFTSVNVATDAAPNVALVAATVQHARQGAREGVILSAQLARSGGTGDADVPVTLDFDGRIVETVHARFTAGSASARFSAAPEPTRALRVRITIPSDPLPHDDTLNLVLESARTVHVLVIAAHDASAGESLYLQHAFGVAIDPSFAVTVRHANGLSAADLSQAELVVLNDAPMPSGDAGRRLRTMIASGAGLFVALGARGSVLPRDLADSVGTAGAAADRTSEGGAALSPTGYDHPVFAPFREPRSGDFSAARALHYRPIAPATAGSVLARFDDGAPALVEGAWGRGRIMLFGTDLANRWNDLPLQPVFVPFLHQLARHLARYDERPPARQVGQSLDLASLGVPPGSAAVVEHPGGGRTTIEPNGASHVRFDEAGFYTVRPPLDRTRAYGMVAVNSDPTESDLTTFDSDQLSAAVAPSSQPEPVSDSDPPVSGSTAVREREQMVWWYLLMTVLLLMGAETVVAARAEGR